MCVRNSVDGWIHSITETSIRQNKNRYDFNSEHECDGMTDAKLVSSTVPVLALLVEQHISNVLCKVTINSKYKVHLWSFCLCHAR